MFTPRTLVLTLAVASACTRGSPSESDDTGTNEPTDAGEVTEPAADAGPTEPERVPGWARHAAAELISLATTDGEDVEVYGVFEAPGVIEPGGRLESGTGGGVFRARYSQRGELIDVLNLAITSGWRPLEPVMFARSPNGDATLLGTIRPVTSGDTIYGEAVVQLGAIGAPVELAAAPTQPIRFLARFDQTGAVLYVIETSAWMNAYVSSVVALDDGFTIVSGTRTGATMIGSIALADAGSTQLWMARVDPAGQPVWAIDVAPLPPASASRVLTVAAPGGSALISHAGHVTLVGAGGTIDARWSRPGEVEAIDIDAAGNLLVLLGVEASLVFVRHHAGGGAVFEMYRVGRRVPHHRLLRALDDGGFVVAGAYSRMQEIGEGPTAASLPEVDGYAAFTARFGPLGEVVWANAVEPLSMGQAQSYATALAVSASGAVITCGLNREPVRLSESDWTRDLAGPGAFIARYSGVPAAISHAPPQIVSFTASDTEVAVGETVTLSWQVTGAMTIQIDTTPPLAVDAPSPLGGLSLPPMGTVESEPLQVDTSMRLIVIGPGGTARSELAITVR